MKNGYFIVICFISIAVVGLYSWFFFGNLGYELSTKPELWGAFGDYVGGLLNPIIAGVGLILLLKTLQQNDEVLRLNIEEMKHSRTEFERSADAQSELAAFERESVEIARNIRQLEALGDASKYLENRVTQLLTGEVIGLTYKKGTGHARETLRFDVIAEKCEGGLTAFCNNVQDLDEFKDRLRSATQLIDAFATTRSKIQNLETEIGVDSYCHLSLYLVELSMGLDNLSIRNREDIRAKDATPPKLQEAILEFHKLVHQYMPVLLPPSHMRGVKAAFDT